MECEPLVAQTSVNHHAQFAAGRIRDGEREMATPGGSWGGPQQTKGNPRQVNVQILTVPSRISWSVPSALFTRNDRVYSSPRPSTAVSGTYSRDREMCMLPKRECMLPKRECMLPKRECMLPKRECMLPKRECMLR